MQLQGGMSPCGLLTANLCQLLCKLKEFKDANQIDSQLVCPPAINAAKLIAIRISKIVSSPASAVARVDKDFQLSPVRFVA